jgi:hypothetical protein
MRVSKQPAAENRQKILPAAARLSRHVDAIGTLG